MIGAGAVLRSGTQGSIVPATLHAQLSAATPPHIRAAAVDFEGTCAGALSRLVVVVPGWDAGRFRRGVTDALVARRDCTLADVLQTLSEAAQTRELHLFAHWLPDEATCAQLAAHGITIVAHPLESIEAAALVAGQRHTRWPTAA